MNKSIILMFVFFLLAIPFASAVCQWVNVVDDYIAYYPFDYINGSSDYVIENGEGTDGIVEGLDDDVYKYGINGSIEFGNSDYLTTNLNQDDLVYPITYSIWFKSYDNPPWDSRHLVFSSLYGTDIQLFSDISSDEICIRFHEHDGGGSNDLCSDGLNLNINDWYYLTLVMESNNTGYLYINGELNNTGNGLYHSTESYEILISAASSSWDGRLDEMAIIDKALNSTEISEIYNSGDGKRIDETSFYNNSEILYYNDMDFLTDISGNSNPHAYNGLEQSSPGFNDTVNNSAASFDGVNDFIDMTDSAPVEYNGVYSISVWINPDSLGSGDADCIYANNLGGGPRRTLCLEDSEIVFQEYDGSSWMSSCGANGCEADVTINSSEWTYVTIVHKGWDDIDMWINGVNRSMSGEGIPNPGATSNTLGGINDGSMQYFYDGLIDEVRLYNRTLTTSEISSLYTYGNGYLLCGVDGLNSTITTTTPIYTNEELICRADWDAGSQNVTDTNISMAWYNESVLFSSTTYNDTSEDTYYYLNVGSGNTSHFQNWTCNVSFNYIIDGVNTWDNQTNAISISNYVPSFDYGPLSFNDYHTTNIDLDYNCTEIDPEDNIIYYITNITADLASNLSINSTTGSIFYNLIPTDKGNYNYNITCGDIYENASNSFLNITVLNHIPTVPNTLSPADGYETLQNETIITCSNGTDADNDTLYYWFYANDTLVQNTTSTNYTYPHPTYGIYNWSCNAFDTEDHSANITLRELTYYTFSNNGTCSGGQLIYNLTLYDEENRSALTGNMDANFNFTGEENSFMYYIDEDSQHEFDICVSPNLTQNMTVNAFIQYDVTDYDARNYFLRTDPINMPFIQTNEISLYSLLEASGTLINFEILDSSGSPMDGSYIYVERYIPEEDGYYMVAMGLADSNGETSLYLRGVTTPDAWYLFKIYDDTELVYTTEPTRIYDDDIEIRVGATSWLDASGVIEDITGEIAFSDYTFTGSFSTYSGSPRYGCLRVIEKTPLRDEVVYDECQYSASSTSGYLQYEIEDSSYDHSAYLYTHGSGIWNIASLFYEIPPFEFGSAGLLIALAIIITLGLIGSFHPVAMIILTMAGVLTSSALELVAGSHATIMGVIVLGLLMLLKNKE